MYPKLVAAASFLPFYNTFDLFLKSLKPFELKNDAVFPSENWELCPKTDNSNNET